ncbi:HAD family hydrolase [Companilactobacillus farciminis]|uniref:HAD family hydrolase n=1 Tax=Companilactobacillus farciminis TaxID=1612 RepID=UPI0002197A45|nr:HAD hydrolase family protein [Companilactobacillus farciminis]
MAEIKVVATDIDDTLFDDDKNYDVKRLNDYIDKLHQKNILFTVASGNNYDHLRRIFEKTPDIDLFIAENGAQIVEAGKTIFEHPMPKTLVHDMIKSLNSELDLKSLSISGKKSYLR